jgi:hypothetical protein
MSQSNGAHPTLTFAELPDVQESEASSDVRAVFEEITSTVRVPFLGLFWRVLASEPVVLQAAWTAVAPNMKTWAFERAAAAIRERALIAEAASISSHKAFKGDLVRAEIDFDLRSKIGNFNALACYALAKHLLAVTMLLEALEDRAPAGGSGDASQIPQGLAEGAVPVPPVDPRTARGRAAELLPIVAGGHGHPTAEDYFRSLARMPDYLAASWNALKPVVRDPEYDARGRELVSMAAGSMQSLPHPVTLGSEWHERAQQTGLMEILGLFRDSILPDTLMDAAIVKALTDGPDRALENPYAL